MKRPSILLIEDDMWLGELYRDILTDAGYRVRHALSAEEGLRILDDMPETACILLDLFLPSHNGIEFLHECASYDDTTHIPVIILSGTLPRDIGIDIRRWQQYGVVAHLYKPAVKPDILLHEVASAITIKERDELLA